MLLLFDREPCLETGSCVMHEGCSGIVKGLGCSLGIGRSRRVHACAHTHTHTHTWAHPPTHTYASTPMGTFKQTDMSVLSTYIYMWTLELILHTVIVTCPHAQITGTQAHMCPPVHICRHLWSSRKTHEHPDRLTRA